MRAIQFCYLATLVAAGAGRCDTPADNTPIAHALGWYSTWFGASQKRAGPQTCRGELREGIYGFRCDPLAVVVSAGAERLGGCSILNMRPSVEERDGLRVNALPNLVPPPKTPPAQPRQCGELPMRAGPFEFGVTPSQGGFDKDLSDAARTAALALIKLGGDRGCTLYFPKVRTGDPFAHVYSECDGALESVMEFQITNGQIADYAQWTYDRNRKDIPPGAQERLADPTLWLGVSRPEDRRKSRK